MSSVILCQGGSHLVSGLAAVHAFGGTKAGYLRLICHDFFVSPCQQEDFFCAVRLMAEALSSWRSVTFWRPDQIAAWDEDAFHGSWARLRDAIRRDLGEEPMGQIFFSQNRTVARRLALASSPEACAICFGDGMGVNFSEDYFLQRNPSNPKGATNSIWTRTSRRILAIRPSNAARAIRRMAATSRRAIRRIASRANGSTCPAEERAPDRYGLLFPNLFDEFRSEFTQLDPAFFLASFRKLAEAIGDVHREILVPIRETACSASRVVLLLSTNFSEAGRCRLADEIEAYRKLALAQRQSSRDLLVLKPHPRDSKEKIQQLVHALGMEFRKRLVLDHPLLFYLPFEALYADAFAGRRDSLAILAFSSACLTLERLFRQPTELGFGEETVRSIFHPEWVEPRLRHEADLRRAIALLRAEATQL